MLAVAGGVAEAATLLVLAAVVLVSAPIPAAIGVVYFGLASLFYVKVLQARTRRNARIVQQKAATVIRLIQEGWAGFESIACGVRRPIWSRRSPWTGAPRHRPSASPRSPAS